LGREGRPATSAAASQAHETLVNPVVSFYAKDNSETADYLKLPYEYVAPWYRREHPGFESGASLLHAEKTQKNRFGHSECVSTQGIIQKRRNEKKELSIMHYLCALSNTSSRKRAVVACIAKSFDKSASSRRASSIPEK
jgi:hypothetical protein